MAIQDELFQMDGIIAVGTIDDMGRIVDWKAKGYVSNEVQGATSKFMASMVSLLAQRLVSCLEIGAHAAAGHLEVGT